MITFMKYSLLSLTFLLFGCPEKRDPKIDSFVKISNMSPNTVLFFAGRAAFPDITLQEGYPFFNMNFDRQIILPHSFVVENGSLVFSLSRRKENSFYYFLLDKDTLLAQGWDSVRDNYKVLKRFPIVADSFTKKNTVTLIYP